MPKAKKPTRKAAPKRYYLLEAFDDRGAFTIYLGIYRSVAEREATMHAAVAKTRITTYVRLPRKRGKR